jgi:hypothetical protein
MYVLHSALRAKCITLSYQLGVREITESTEQQTMKTNKKQGERLLMAWMLPELPTMLTVEFVKSINNIVCVCVCIYIHIYIYITYSTKGEKKRLKKDKFSLIPM